MKNGGTTSPPSSAAVAIVLVGILLVGTVVTAVHWPVLSAQALCFDDREFLSDNPLVQNPSLATAGRFLSEVWNPSTVRGYYIPLTMITLMVDYAAGGRPDNLRAFHRTNLLLHVLTTAAIAVLLTMLFGNPWVALIGALLFGLHPLTVEPIAWIGERKTVLATCLAVWAMVAHVRAVRRKDAGLIVVASVLFLLSLLAKPTTTTLPVLLLLLDYWPLRRLNRRALVEKLPYFAVAGVMGVVTILSNARGAGLSPTGQGTQAPMYLKVCHNLLLYFEKLIYPAHLTSYYPPPDPFDLTNGAVLAGVLGTALLVALLIASLRWTRAWAVGLGFFFIALSPTLGIIDFSWILASDKYVYFPAVGLLLLFAFYAGRLWRDPPRQPSQRLWRIAMILTVTATGVLWAKQTRHYLASWRDSEGLYRHMLAIAPDVPVLHYSLGNVLSDRGRKDEAIAEYTLAIQENDRYADAHVGLGKALVEQGNTSGAIEQFVAALRIQPDNLNALSNLGTTLSEIGRTDEAAAHLEEAIRINPNYAPAHYNLAMNLQRQGRPAEAVEEYRTALRLRPGFYEAHANLARILEKRGDLVLAVNHYRAAMRLSGGHPAIRRRLVEAEKALAESQRRR